MDAEEFIDMRKGPAFQPTHPGVHIREDVLPALGMTVVAFAKHLGVSRNTLYKVMNGEQPITLDFALRLGAALGNGPRFWLALQSQYDVWHAQRAGRCKIKPINWTRAA